MFSSHKIHEKVVGRRSFLKVKGKTTVVVQCACRKKNMKTWKNESFQMRDKIKQTRDPGTELTTRETLKTT